MFRGAHCPLVIGTKRLNSADTSHWALSRRDSPTGTGRCPFSLSLVKRGTSTRPEALLRVHRAQTSKLRGQSLRLPPARVTRELPFN